MTHEAVKHYADIVAKAKAWDILYEQMPGLRFEGYECTPKELMDRIYEPKLDNNSHEGKA